MKSRFAALSVAALLAVALFVPFGGGAAGAQGATSLKIATLAPANSSIMRVLNAWKQSVSQETSGQVTLEFVSLPRTADEAEVARKIQSGEYDGAMLTAVGLERTVPQALVFGAPGVFGDYDDLDRARTRLASDVERTFRDAPNGGYQFLGWADFGKARIFSRLPFQRRSDLAGKKFWVAGQGDVIGSAYASGLGATPLTNIGIGNVARSLEGGQVDAIYASALAAVSLNWHTRFTHVSKQHVGFIPGATFVRAASFERVPEAHRAVVTSTAARAHQALARSLRRDDDRNYQSALQRGVTEVDLAADRAGFDQAAAQARTTLTGRVFPAQLLQRVSGR